MFPSAVERWRPLAVQESARWGSAYGVSVPVDTVLAIVQAESSGNPRATRREPDGRVSRGLMQVLDPTARDLGITDVSSLYVPAVGISTGVKYFAQRLKRYGGSVPKAVAAYNAGSAIFREDETFKNQDYVDKVLRFLRAGVAGAAATLERDPVKVIDIALGLATVVVLGAAIARGRRAAAA